MKKSSLFGFFAGLLCGVLFFYLIIFKFPFSTLVYAPSLHIANNIFGSERALTWGIFALEVVTLLIFQIISVVLLNKKQTETRRFFVYFFVGVLLSVFLPVLIGG